MLLSVIVPMYNANKYLNGLKTVIDKVDNNDIEFILINDGSKDNTYNTCKSLFDSYENVRIFSNENHGVSFTRNYGVNNALGKYVMFWDCDDLLVDNWNKIVLDAIYNHIDSDIIIFSDKLENSIAEKKDLISSMLGISSVYNSSYLAAPWSKVFKREFLLSNNIKFNINIIHGEDLLFNIEAILLSSKCVTVNTSIYLYFINMSSVTHNFDYRFLDSNKYFLECLKSLLIKYYDEEFVINCFSYSFVNSLFIFAGKLSKVKSFKEICKISNDFYDNSFYSNNLKNINFKSILSFKLRIIYLIFKLRFLFIFVIFVSFFRKKKNIKKEKYILA